MTGSTTRARYLNTALLLRLLCEIAAIVLVTLLVRDAYDGAFWPASLLTSIGDDAGVLRGHRRRAAHPRPAALPSASRLRAGAVWAITKVLGPIPRLLILLGNAITPGKGFREGPFATEAELRELVDLAEASAVIESGERQMIHSVFELGDTIVREVMVPRTDMVFIERHKTLRQTMSLSLRSGFSRIPVIGENLDDVVGVAYLKDIVRRDFEAPEAESTERVERGDAAAVSSCPTPSRSTSCCARCRPSASTSRSSSTSTAAPPGWSPSRTSSRRSSARSPTSTTSSTGRGREARRRLGRVTSRYPIDDLDELFGSTSRTTTSTPSAA